jgi:hypothetical protein
MAVINGGQYTVYTSCEKLSTPEVVSFRNAWQLSPNPASDCIFIDLKQKEPNVFKVVIRNESGQLMHSAETARRLDLSVQHWPDGLYFVTLSDKEGIQDVKRLVVRHGQP